MLSTELKSVVLSTSLTSDLRDLILLIETEIQARENEVGSTYTVSDFTKAQTKISVIRLIREMTNCQLSEALSTYDKGRLTCCVITSMQRVTLETFRELGCTVVKSE